MPKLELMAQISRPFQIALVALLALAMMVVAWFMVLHRSTATESSGTSSPSVASSAGSSASHVATRTTASGAGSGHVYHGPVPGLEGLTRDVKRAHEAAAQEARGGSYDEQHAGQTPTATASTGASGAAAHHPAVTVHTHHAVTTVHTSHAVTTVHTSHAVTTVHTSHAVTTVHTSHAVTTVHTSHAVTTVHTSHAAGHTHQGAAATHSHSQTNGPNAPAATAALTLHNLTEAVHLKAVVNLVEAIDPALGLKGKLAHAEGVFIAKMKADLQPASAATVAAELHQGKVVLLLFLNPHAYDDDATAIGATEVAYRLRHHVAAHLALADQVNSFGSITRDIQVYQTPTLLMINPKREVTTVTGLTDEFSLEQAIAEAKG